MKTCQFVIVSLLLLAACKAKQEPAKSKENAPQKVLVDVMVASAHTIQNTVEANGAVIADEFVELRSEVNGRLVYVNIQEGAQVEKGTVLAKINDADLQAQLNKAKVSLSLATKTEERLRKLLSISGINQADYDVALNQVNSLKADIAYTQAMIEKTVLRAPFSGTLGLRQVSMGAYLTAANVITTVQKLDRKKIDFTLPETYRSLIVKGKQIDVLVPGKIIQSLTAEIIATEPQANSLSRNIKVRAILNGGNLTPGAYVKVKLANSSINNTILVPTNCIIPDDKKKQLVLVKEGKALFTTVETGERTAGMIEILKGVNPGDSVVVTGVLFAKPKADLKIRSIKTFEQLNQ